jgi:hypothetical protein
MRVFVAVEDELSLAFARRLISEQQQFEVYREIQVIVINFHFNGSEQNRKR